MIDINKKGFTLLELIVVIIIIGILATLGYTQYANIVEKNRLAEAKVRIGLMRQLAHEYCLKNGSLNNIQNSDLGIDDPDCNPTNYYRYGVYGHTATWIGLAGERCTQGMGGKPPTPPASRGYRFWLQHYYYTGQSVWHCYYLDNESPCFGFSAKADPG